MDIQTTPLPEKDKYSSLGIPALLAWVMAITGFMLPFVLFLIPVKNWTEHPGLFGACLSAMAIIWVIFLADVIKSKIRDKSFWILSILIMPTIAQIFYLVRKKHILL